MTQSLSLPAPASPDAVDPALLEQSIALVRQWLDESRDHPVAGSAALLAGVLKDPKGLRFTTQFVDGVMRPEDTAVAARTLARIAPDVPRFVPAWMKIGVRLGGWFGPLLPGLVIPIARRILRMLVSHLIIDARPTQLTKALEQLRDDATGLNLNLLGEAVLGHREADHRLGGTIGLLKRDDVDYVSLKVSSSVAPHALWAFDDSVTHVVERLTPLFAQAVASGADGQAKFVNLDMEEYPDLNLTIAVFTKLLDQPQFAQIEAGIVLQAYLPDALAAYQRLETWAQARRAAGGAAIKVRLVKGANLPMEAVQASLTGWPLATCRSKRESDTNYLRVLNYALTPQRIDAIHLGIAGHNLFDIAYAWLLAGQRGVRAGIEFEMLLGMAEGQVAAVKREVGRIRLYTPVVAPAEFDVAIAYLVRRLEEGASSENFMSAVFDLATDGGLFEREKQRFLDSVADLDGSVPPPNRRPDRFAEAPRPESGAFACTPDTDPSLAVNQDWARQIYAAVAGSTAGQATVEAGRVATPDDVAHLVEQAVAAGRAWAERPLSDRAEVLHRAGEELEARRAAFLEVMAAEAGKTIDQGDPEISEGVDFAHYYAERALELDVIDGAESKPRTVTLVTPPWNFPMSIPAGGALAALAAGSAVIFKPAALTRRTGALVAEALWAAGVPEDVLQFVAPVNHDVGQALVTNPAVDQVILTGAYETAERFRSMRPDLPLFAETSGKNAIIITPSADLNLAVKDVVYSAFAHAGQKCSAASLLVLVGSMGRSRRLRDQLVDAVTSLQVGPAWQPSTKMGPLVDLPGAKLLRGLTELEPGQNWLIRPRQLDDSGSLWSPGVRAGVKPGSEFHRVEYFGPVLGIMLADSLAEAVEIVNAVDYGLTSGLHSLDRDEIAYWLDHIQAGNLYVNRTITGAIVQRQPFGGWKKSAVGPGAKAGGPNYLIGLCDWEWDKTGIYAAPPSIGQVSPEVQLWRDAAAASFDIAEQAWLSQAITSDAEALAGHFASADITGLSAEINVLRYVQPLLPVQVRLAEGGSVEELVRVIAAGLAAEARMEVSTPKPLPAQLARVLVDRGTYMRTETDMAFAERLTTIKPSRVRLVGATAASLLTALKGRVDLAIWAGPVTPAGRIELLPFLQEQSVTITAHRFGTPDPMTTALV